MIAKGGSSVSKFYLGSSEVTKIYKGDTLVYGGTSPVLPYDAEVEYLQTDGTAYISTGYAPADITPILETRIYLPTTSATKYVCGADGSGNGRFSIGRLTSSRIELRIGNYKNTGSKPAGWYTIRMEGDTGKGYINGTLLYTSTYLTYTSPMPILLWSSWSGNNNQYQVMSGVRFSSFKLWNGSTLLLDFIPVRKDGVGYMYDKVSGELFGNAAASGAFTYGADVSS